MTRHERLGDLLERRGIDAVVLRRPANFAWYTGGADTKVDRVASDGSPISSSGRTPGFVLTSTIEAARLRAEQPPALEVVDYAWHEDRDAALR